MRKISMLAATLLLSGICAVAQTTPSSQPTDQSTSPSTSSPSSTSPSQSSSPSQSTSPSQSSVPDNSSASSTGNSNSIEGCLSGSAGSYSLTDQSGKTWQLSGDTSKLTEHVGHQVQIMGSSNDSSSSSSGSTGSGSSSASSGSTSGGSSSGGSTFNVRRVKMISSSCSNK